MHDLGKGGGCGKKEWREPVVISLKTLFRPFLSRLDSAVKLSKFQLAGIILIFPVRESRATQIPHMCEILCVPIPALKYIETCALSCLKCSSVRFFF